MSNWFADIASKTESFLNKIDQKTANVLNISNDLIPTKVNDENEFIVTNNLANSQSLPQLKSIFVSSDPENEFKQAHSREPSTASYHGLTMKDTSYLKNKFLNKTIDDGQLFNYLNNKEDHNLNVYINDGRNNNNESTNQFNNNNSLNNSTNNQFNLNNSINSQFNNLNGNSIGINNLNNSTNLTNPIIQLNNSPVNQMATPNNKLVITNSIDVEKQNQKEQLKNLLKEEKRKLNELKLEYKKHSDTLTGEINFLKVKLDQRSNQENKDPKLEINNLKEKLKLERLNKEKFEKEISVLNSSFSRLKNEFEDYKIRAQRTLQTKDNEIENLEKNLNLNQKNQENNELDKRINEFKELENLNKQLKEELEELKLKYLNLENDKSEFRDERIMELDNQLKESKYELNELRNLNVQLENELKNNQNEFNKNLESEYSKLKNQFELELENKQNQINELNKQINLNQELKLNQQQQQSIPQDLELKIKNLTENLLNKQTLVEHLKREKNSLVIQLEDSKRQFNNLQNQNSNYYINFKDGLSERQTNLTKDNNLNDNFKSTPVGRRVRKAYSQLDQFR